MMHSGNRCLLEFVKRNNHGGISQGRGWRSMTTDAANENRTQQPGTIEGSVLGVTGFALATSALLISAYSPLLATSLTNTPVMHGITHGIMFAFMAAMYFALSRFIGNRDAFVRSRLWQSAFLILQVALPAIALAETAFGTTAPFALILAAWATAGAACAFFFCAWIEAQSTLGADHIRSVNLWSFGMAGCITNAVLAMPRSTSLLAFILICVVALILLMQASRNALEIIDERDEQWFAENSSFSKSGSYIMTIDGVVTGVIAGLLVARVSKEVLPPSVMGLAFVLVALIFFVLDKKSPSLLALGKSQLVFFPVVVCTLILSGFLDAPWNTVAAIPLFIVLYLLDYTNSSVLSLRGCILSMSPCYCFAKGRLFIILGQGIGWLGGAFLASETGHGLLPLASFIMIALACTYIAVATIRPDKYPIIGEAAPEAQKTAIETPPPRGFLRARPYARACA